MTTGEKIKCFRALKNMTQKTLGELTEIGEATIRKYELGIRNPKPAQLKKIAQALDVGENIFFDIPLNTLEIKTIGDVMALFFLLYDKVGLIPYPIPTQEKPIDPQTLMFHFTNDKVNELIEVWLEDERVEENDLDILNDKLRRNEISKEEYDNLFRAAKSIIELTRNECMKNAELLDPQT